VATNTIHELPVFVCGVQCKADGPKPNTKCPGYLKTDKLEIVGNFGTRGTEYLQAELGSAFRSKATEGTVETHSGLQIGRKIVLGDGGLR
jgi:hypothetical protein